MLPSIKVLKAFITKMFSGRDVMPPGCIATSNTPTIVHWQIWYQNILRKSKDSIKTFILKYYLRGYNYFYIFFTSII